MTPIKKQTIHQIKTVEFHNKKQINKTGLFLFFRVHAQFIL